MEPIPEEGQYYSLIIYVIFRIFIISIVCI